MTDITSILSELLESHDACLAKPSLNFQSIDEFLKEAYQINAHITSLNTYLKAIRLSYLSTAGPPRRSRPLSQDSKVRYLTDREREEIDAATKQALRELNASIRNLADAEQLRQNTQTTVTRKKYARLGLGALGAWAAGGAGQVKSFEQEQEESKALAISTHRESVLWYLRTKLQQCGSIQAAMMEKRIRREMEKNKSVLEKSEWGPMHDYGVYDSAASPSSYHSAGAAHTEAPQFVPEEELTPEQIQIFEKQNQDMLKQYESTLNQVSKAEKSLLEISELQTQLVNNLATQSAHIDQLVADSFYTAENIGGGNKQLKKATERQSTAKYVFYASCGLSLFLIMWDLII